MKVAFDNDFDNQNSGDIVAPQAGEHLRTISRLMVELQQLNFACCDVNSVTQCSILITLARAGDQTLVSLTRRLNLDKAWLSRTTDNMVENGLILKKRHPSDRRALLIQLTESGRQTAQNLDEQLNAQSTRVLQRLRTEDRAQAIRILQAIEEALEKEVEAAPCCE